MTIHPAFVYVPVTLCIVLLLFIITLLLTRKNSAGGPEKSLDQLERIQQRLDQMHTIFSVPYLRGGMGETLLEELLSNWLPSKMYSMQYSFGSGDRADAVIFLGDYTIAVDAKFPLQSIKSALEEEPSAEVVSPEIKRTFTKYIRSISSKYIRPSEGTLQFALMYLPSEKIYYHTFVTGPADLLQEALDNGVIPVGPSSLFLYIQTVAYGLKGLTLPREQKEFARLILQIRKEFDQLVRTFSVTGTHIKNLVKSYEETQNRMMRLGFSLDAAAGERETTEEKSSE